MHAAERTCQSPRRTGRSAGTRTTAECNPRSRQLGATSPLHVSPAGGGRSHRWGRRITWRTEYEGPAAAGRGGTGRSSSRRSLPRRWSGADRLLLGRTPRPLLHGCSHARCCWWACRRWRQPEVWDVRRDTPGVARRRRLRGWRLVRSGGSVTVAGAPPAAGSGVEPTWDGMIPRTRRCPSPDARAFTRSRSGRASRVRSSATPRHDTWQQPRR